jgi:hypothetical protein
MAAFTSIVLTLFVINLGIAFGAGLYESRITVPQWLSFSTESGYHWNAEAARRANAGLRFWVYVTTIPLTLLTLVSLVVAWWAPSEVRNWWFAAAIVVLVDRVMTFGYFIPTMLTLMNHSTISASEAVAKATQWINLGYVRHIATLAGWLASLRAFSLLSKLG